MAAATITTAIINTLLPFDDEFTGADEKSKIKQQRFLTTLLKYIVIIV